MRGGMWNAMLVAAMFVVAAHAQQQGGASNADQLVDAARRAHDAGDLQKEADDLCRAAEMNLKFAKRCEKAKDRVSKSLAQFDANYKQAIFEAQHRDFSEAIRDLSKITFGPHHATALALLPQLRVVGDMGTPEDLSRTALRLASASYNAGKLEEAESWLKFVTFPALQAAKNQMETNIRVYRQTMQQANQLLAQLDWNGAAQQLEFAIHVLPTGPGDPQGQLRQVQAQIAANQRAAQQNAQAAAAEKAANEAKIRTLLELGSKDEARGNADGAAKAYAAVLAIDPSQKDAIAGRRRALAKPVDDPRALESLLKQGVSQFYTAQYSQAGDSLNAYIAKGGKLHAGAAQFYLGAVLIAQQLLGDPKDAQRADDLRQQAQEHFEEARKLKFAPLEAAVSPKILEQWTQTGRTQ